MLDYPGLNKPFSASGANSIHGCMWCDIQGNYIIFIMVVVLPLIKIVFIKYMGGLIIGIKELFQNNKTNAHLRN